MLLNFQKKLKINGHAILWNNFYVNKEYLKKKRIKLHDWLKNKIEFIDKGYPQKCGHHRYIFNDSPVIIQANLDYPNPSLFCWTESPDPDCLDLTLFKCIPSLVTVQ